MKTNDLKLEESDPFLCINRLDFASFDSHIANIHFLFFLFSFLSFFFSLFPFSIFLRRGGVGGNPLVASYWTHPLTVVIWRTIPCYHFIELITISSGIIWVGVLTYFLFNISLLSCEFGDGISVICQISNILGISFAGTRYLNNRKFCILLSFLAFGYWYYSPLLLWLLFLCTSSLWPAMLLYFFFLLTSCCSDWKRNIETLEKIV